MKESMVDFNKENAPDKVEYPAEFHFRVICDAAVDLSKDIVAVAESYKITKILSKTNSSRSGKYISYSISLIFEKREHMICFDETIKAIPGVRMLL